jgi:hypothetical protein
MFGSIIGSILKSRFPVFAKANALLSFDAQPLRRISVGVCTEFYVTEFHNMARAFWNAGRRSMDA